MDREASGIGRSRTDSLSTMQHGRNSGIALVRKWVWHTSGWLCRLGVGRWGAGALGFIFILQLSHDLLCWCQFLHAVQLFWYWNDCGSISIAWLSDVIICHSFRRKSMSASPPSRIRFTGSRSKKASILHSWWQVSFLITGVVNVNWNYF